MKIICRMDMEEEWVGEGDGVAVGEEGWEGVGAGRRRPGGGECPLMDLILMNRPKRI